YTPIGCVQSAAADCFLSRSDPPTKTNPPVVGYTACMSGNVVFDPAVTLQIKQSDPVICHVLVVCDDGREEFYQISYDCGSIGLSTGLGPITACVRNSDGGTD